MIKGKVTSEYCYLLGDSDITEAWLGLGALIKKKFLSKMFAYSTSKTARFNKQQLFIVDIETGSLVHS